MNTAVAFPARPPALKLPRTAPSRAPEEKWTPSLDEERRRLEEDHEALRVREANLRDYEARLRALQEEIEAGRVVQPAPARTVVPFPRSVSRAPFEGDGALQTGWEKLHRARELFEAEQAHLRDERLIAREREVQFKRREEALAVREAKLAEREAMVAAAYPPVSAEPIAAEHTMSAVTRLTRAPFDMARSVFGAKK
jgi:DNA repair exonuclease SbcCD ATPase subunit